MRTALLVLLTLILLFVGRELYLFYGRKSYLGAELGSVNAELDKLRSENRNLEADASYYADPKNLEKEARAQLNYKAPEEKMIIVVPQQ